MSPQVKAALIIAGGIIVGISLWMYLSPYQSCVRAETASLETRNIRIANGELDHRSSLTNITSRPDLIDDPGRRARLTCARVLGGGG